MTFLLDFKERPILFSGPMVRAILEGRKTQTRRVINVGKLGQENFDLRVYNGGLFRASKGDIVFNTKGGGLSKAMQDKIIHCPFGKPGDLLWVREKWHPIVADAEKICDSVLYAADGYSEGKYSWRPSIHMPRWACRIVLEVKDVRIQRLQEISEEGAIAEGITGPHHVGYPAFHCPGDSKPRYNKASAAFESLWDTRNAKRGFGWDKNPWVWAITFERLST